MEKIFCLFSILLLSGLVGVNSLQCFVCFNCTTPGADDLRTCGEPVTTTQSPTVPTTTGIPTSPSTRTPSTTASSTTPSTTNASSTTASSTTASSTTPSTTTTSSTTTSSTTPSTTTTSTNIPPTTNTTTSATTLSTTTTSTTIPPTEAPVDPPVDPPVSPEPERRSKRNVMSPVAVSRVSKFEDIEYVCYKVTAILNNETVIERGCAPAVINDKELCENDVIKNVTTSCSTCKTDKCNGSYAVQFSTALLAAAVVGLLFCK